MQTQNLNIRSALTARGYLKLNGPNSQQIIEIQDLMIVGRDPQAQIQVNGPYVSARHARITHKENGFFIQDLRSSNGTFVNGSRIIEAKLQDHDRIMVGLTEYNFYFEKSEELDTILTTSLNAKWDHILKRLPHIALSPHPVLILGPSGVGKEVIAQLLHRYSSRSTQTFLSVNCSALSENLAESELFGHVKGSFTGAQTDRKGAFQAARKGTLFLDEIGDMPLSLQPKFLRALENKEIKAVGSDQTQSTDVRIIAATNKNLKELVRLGKFREDLYFRLHILQVQPPPLVERMEDFDRMLQYFARPQKVYFTANALAKLKAHTWPGNVRELKNAVSRAAALFGQKPVTEENVDEMIEPVNDQDLRLSSTDPQLARKLLKQYERDAIVKRLILFEGNQRQTAADLGMAKSTLNDRIKRYGINIDELLKAKTTPP